MIIPGQATGCSLSVLGFFLQNSSSPRCQKPNSGIRLCLNGEKIRAFLISSAIKFNKSHFHPLLKTLAVRAWKCKLHLASLKSPTHCVHGLEQAGSLQPGSPAPCHRGQGQLMGLAGRSARIAFQDTPNISRHSSATSSRAPSQASRSVVFQFTGRSQTP